MFEHEIIQGDKTFRHINGYRLVHDEPIGRWTLFDTDMSIIISDSCPYTLIIRLQLDEITQKLAQKKPVTNNNV
tara:strand:- start:67 stop:288 length:222 start_codon:yes stop_codon:yes gene_type:complete